jgi:uracil-DNA glycosylase
MPINYSDKEFVEADDKYVVCMTNCLDTKVAPEKEPTLHRLFNKFPHADVYRLKTGAHKPGTIILKGDGKNERFVVSLFCKFYPEKFDYPNDNHAKRLAWFIKGMDALAAINHLTSIAISNAQISEVTDKIDTFIYALSDFDKGMALKGKKVNITIYGTGTTSNKISALSVTPVASAVPVSHVVPVASAGPVSHVAPVVPVASAASVVPVDVVPVTTVVNASDRKSIFNVINRIPIKLSDIYILDVKEQFKESPSDLKKPTIVKTETIETIETTVAAEATVAAVATEAAVAAEATEAAEAAEVAVATVALEPVSHWDQNPDWTKKISELVESDIHGWNEVMLDGKIQSELLKIDGAFEKEMKVFGDFVSILPKQPLIFNAFKLCPLNKLKVVILGQDPYYANLDEAMGLSFSTPKGVTIPPSLKNIFKELESDILGYRRPDHGDLTCWAEQGVLLLNTALTVRHGKAGAHMEIWKAFTDRIIELISQKTKNVVFLLWGLPAQKKGNLIDGKKHNVLTCAHPSPLSAAKGWFGCKHFSKTNEMLIAWKLSEIKW